MRHNKSHRRLGRPSDHRRAMLRNLATSFMEHGCIKTTLHRAKELRPIVEKLVTRAKNASVHDQRILAAYLFTGTAVKNLVNSHAKQNATRAGGYTRIVKHGVRFGDGAKIATLEFVESAV